VDALGIENYTYTLAYHIHVDYCTNYDGSIGWAEPHLVMWDSD